MCAIIGSFDWTEFVELMKLNSYRGSHSHSVHSYDVEDRMLIPYVRGFGMFDENDPAYPDFVRTTTYWIGHVQAPTTDSKDTWNIHPHNAFGRNELSYMWHNGVIKSAAIKDMQGELQCFSEWDTALIHEAVIKKGFDALNTINGGFSCLLKNEDGLFLFRNNICPMFVSENLSISSTKTEGFISTQPEIVYRMHFGGQKNIFDGNLEEITKFKTVDDPYYFGE